MKAKQVFVYLIVLALALPGYIRSAGRLREFRGLRGGGVTMRSLPFPINFYKVAAGEFSGLSADFLYLDIASALGGRDEAARYGDADWDRIEKGFAVAVGLDPYFEPTFRGIQAFLAWNAERPRSAIALLEEVSAKRSWHWLPPFFIAFDHYFFLRDNAEASRYFLQAAEREHAPRLLATLGARLAAETGNARLGIAFLRRMMKTAENDEERATYRKRIEALEGVMLLEEAVERYREDFGCNPPALWALILHRYVSAMPKNPYGYPTYYYRDGVVRFDPFPTQGVAAQPKAPRPTPLLPPDNPQP